MPRLRKQFGQRLKNLRRVKHLTQVELADKIALSPSFVSSLERGIDAPSFETLEAIAEALEVPVKELFNFENLYKLKHLSSSVTRQ